MRKALIRRLLSLSMVMLIAFTAKAQYPNTGNHTVCLNSVEPYGVLFTSGSSYAWNILAGTGGGGVITAGATPNLITVNWTSTGNCTLQVVETNSSGCVGSPVSILVTVVATNTIVLTSAAGTNNQTVCVNSPITNITYTTTGATGATITGLPAGVTGNWAANAIIISGSPISPGTFPYLISLTGGCGTVSVTGTITVNSDNTIVLTSGVGTNNQAVCLNSPITNITYSTTGATGATITGLPAGVAGNWAANTVTISGSPSVQGTFTYTITLTGGCGNVTETGSIHVNSENAITLTSAAGTNSQSVCTNSPIITITYTTTGATGATITGLPAGVTGNWLANVVTISGTPSTSGTFNYTITLTGGCGTITASGVIDVTNSNTITLTSAIGTDNQTACINTVIIPIVYATTGATGANITGLPTGVNGSWAANQVTISGSPTVTGTFNYTVTLTGGCGTTTATGSIDVSPVPSTSAISHN